MTDEIKVYNAFFVEPPEDSTNRIGVSIGEHPAILSIFKPGAILTIDSIFVLLNNTTGSIGDNVINELQLSIVPVDDETGYFPSNHAAAVTAAQQNANSYSTYISTITSGNVSTTISNINLLGSQKWIEFKFATGLLTTATDYYGILISDTSNSKNVNNVLFTDKLYGQSSTNRTLYLINDNNELTWQVYQIGNSNIQICIAYQSSEITAGSGLNYGSISTAGPNARRNSGLGMFIKNSTGSNYFTLSNFAPVPASGDTGEIGAENFTFNSNFNWTYFDKNVLPSSKTQILSAKVASNSLNVEVGPEEFIFMYQQDWVAPLPVRYSSISDRRLLYVNGPLETEIDDTAEDVLRDFNQSKTLINNCNSLWTVQGTSLASLNTTDYIQSTGSMQFTVQTSRDLAYFDLGTLDLSGYDHVNLWFKTTNKDIELTLNLWSQSPPFYGGDVNAFLIHGVEKENVWYNLTLHEHLSPNEPLLTYARTISLYVRNTDLSSVLDTVVQLDFIQAVKINSSSRSITYNPMAQFPIETIKVQSENVNNVLSNSKLAKVFSTDYPNRSIITDDLKYIKVNQAIQDSTGVYNFNLFTIDPFYGREKFINSNTGLDLDSDFFESTSYYINSNEERDDWVSDNSLSLYEYNTVGMLNSYGIEISTDSTNELINLTNTKLFPSSSTGSVVTDIRSVDIQYNSDGGDEYVFSRNNTVNLEKISSYNFKSNDLKYKLFFHSSDAANDFPNPPHLILRNYSSGPTDVQNIVLGGICLYTSSYSHLDNSLRLNLSQYIPGVVSESRLSITDRNLASYELPVAKTAISDASSVYGKGLTLTIHSQDLESLNPDIPGENFQDNKYLIRHIIDGVITIEGKVLAYGLGRVELSRPVADKSHVIIKIINMSTYHTNVWTNESSKYVCINPFGFVFDSTGESVSSIVNNADPFDLIKISSITNNIITTDDGDAVTISEIFTDYWPENYVDIPFYIIDIPATASQATNDFTSMVASQYTMYPNTTEDSAWVGTFPDYFFDSADSNTIKTVSGRLISSSTTSPLNNYYDESTSVSLLPNPDANGSIGYSITFPYFDDINNLTSLSWLDVLFSELDSVTNLDVKENDEIYIYENPVEKLRLKCDESNNMYQYHIIEPLSSAKNPTNIFENIKVCDFQNDEECVQIHVSEKLTEGYNNTFKYLSFMYSVDIDTSSTDVSSVCELSLSGHQNGFIISNENPEISLISNISLNVTGDTTLSQSENSTEAIYSYEFDNPISFNDLMLQRIGGDVSSRINNLTLFNDMAVYGKCTNPINIWRNGSSSYCEIQPNGYIIIDLGYARRVYSLEFTVSSSGSSYVALEDNSILFTILGLDPNISNNFNEIETLYNKNDDKINSTTKSFITTGIDRTIKYLLIKPLSTSKSLFLQNLVLSIEDLDVYYYSTTNSYNLPFNKKLFLPTSNTSSNTVDGSIASYNTTSGSILNPVVQPKNYKYATYPYDDPNHFCIMRQKYNNYDPYNEYYLQIKETSSRYDSLYIPVGNTFKPTQQLFYYNEGTLIQYDDIDNVITQTSPITQICFNIKSSKIKNFNNNGVLFKLYYSDGIGVNPYSEKYLYASPFDTDPGSFTFLSSVFAVPYSREPEEGFYTISSLDNRYIYLDTSDIIFANNNLSGYVVRLDIYRDIYAVVRKSDIDKSGRAYIEVNAAVASLGLIPGGQCYFERSNVIALPAFDATWLRLEYVNTSHPVNIFGLKTFVPVTSIADNIFVPVTIPSSFNWDFEINYIAD